MKIQHARGSSTASADRSGRRDLRTGAALRTALKSGNYLSDSCYATRNWENLWGGLSGKGWYPEANLRACLALSGEPLWWKDFDIKDQAEACKETISSNAWFDINFSKEQTEQWKTWKKSMIGQMGCNDSAAMDT